MKFRPLHDRVVLRRLEGDEKTKGGIIIPDTAKEKPQEGEVVAVGPGGRDEAGQMVGHGSEDRRPGAVDHEGERHYGRSHRHLGQEKGRLSRTPASSS